MEKTEQIKKIADVLDLGVTTDSADEDFELDVKGALCQRWIWAYESIIEEHGGSIPETDMFNLGVVAADWIDDEWGDFLAAEDKAAFWDHILTDMRSATEEGEDWTQYIDEDCQED